MAWMPKNVIDEAEELQVEKKLASRSAALNEMVQYARVGRELERIVRLDFAKPMLRDVKPKRRGK